MPSVWRGIREIVYTITYAEKYEMVTKQTLLAPIWTRIGVPNIVFGGESDGNIPEANFCEKRAKMSIQILSRKIKKQDQNMEHTSKTNKTQINNNTQNINQQKNKVRSNI